MSQVYPFEKLSFEIKESLCRQCGKCCHEKLKIGSLVFFTERTCRFLDDSSKRCRVYESRHAEQWNCLGLKEVAQREALPSDCPYILEHPGYNAPLEGLVDDELQVGLEKREPWAGEELIRRMVDRGFEDRVKELYRS